jgi:hypothetical protein
VGELDAAPFELLEQRFYTCDLDRRQDQRAFPSRQLGEVRLIDKPEVEVRRIVPADDLLGALTKSLGPGRGRAPAELISGRALPFRPDNRCTPWRDGAVERRVAVKEIA